jgi:methylphosphotriester-DNA--protein-cysteine methyltransferase
MTIYANKKTKVAHLKGKQRDACRIGALKPSNVAKFTTLQAAKDAGYRSCKRCIIPARPA